jgi:hypothetical protein
MSQSLPKLFAEILDLRDCLGSPIRSLVRPPLPPARIAALFQQTGIRAPQVLLDLYAITDGFERGAPFIAGMRLLPLESALTAFGIWRPILLEYKYPSLFPIAEDEFGAGYGTSLSLPEADPPVLSLPLQCGTDQFYDSVTLMFATLATWLRAGLKSAYDFADGDAEEYDRYCAIARELNPKSCYARAV